MKSGIHLDADAVARCQWCGDDSLYQRYHDTEWGRPVDDDTRVFEKLCLEGFQAGLSWITILRKRENFRAAFDGFDIERVAAFNGRRVNALLKNADIVRHRGKIESTINNARRAIELIESQGSLAAYIWRAEPTAASRPRQLTWTVLKAIGKTDESTALSKDLKRRGWTFVGPTTVYAAMQSLGVVNDHVEGCHVRADCDRARNLAKSESARR